ncbi:MarR family transcriptional regulator [Paenibacillus sp. P26]|nr:MarR family transcriptional regulator [Paenibacillus sp. P26]
MNRDDLLKLDHQFCFALYAYSREITKLYRPILDELGLTYTQYIALLVLWEQDGLTVKELGERLYLDSGTLTPLLKKLESMGSLRRARDPQDERNVIVRLTEQGMQLKEKAYEVPEKMFCRTGMSVEEAAELRERLTVLLKQAHQTVSEE